MYFVNILFTVHRSPQFTHYRHVVFDVHARILQNVFLIHALDWHRIDGMQCRLNTHKHTILTTLFSASPFVLHLRLSQSSHASWNVFDLLFENLQDLETPGK